MATVESHYHDVLSGIYSWMLGGFDVQITKNRSFFENHHIRLSIPVKQDESTIFTCFLEYEADTVKVHDLVYNNTNGQWKFIKSFYRKLRLSPDWVKDRLVQAGFSEVSIDIENGLVTVVAEKSQV